MKKITRVAVVLAVLATFAAGQSILMADPMTAVSNASDRAGLYDRMMSLFGAIWGGAIWGGAIWGGAIWGNSGSGGNNGAIWGNSGSGGNNGAIWGNTGSGGNNGAIWGNSSSGGSN